MTHPRTLKHQGHVREPWGPVGTQPGTTPFTSPSIKPTNPETDKGCEHVERLEAPGAAGGMRGRSAEIQHGVAI